jgi:3-isopropylmalate/(R)-2-methylmalate dehydratase large subunit
MSRLAENPHKKMKIPMRCTYGAFGALSFGIGTTQISHVLATQTLAMDPLKVRRVEFHGKLNKGVTAKDLALYMIRQLSVEGGVGFAYEFGGEVIICQWKKG